MNFYKDKLSFCYTTVREGLVPPGDFETKSQCQRQSVSVHLFPVGKSENDEAIFGGRVKTLPYNGYMINDNLYSKKPLTIGKGYAKIPG